MDRQVSYNGPLSCSPLPCTFPASRPSIPMNHPFTPKPSISMYFHVYTPARKPATVLRDAAAQHIGHGKPIPVNNDRERPSAHNHTTASSGLLSGPHKDSVICPSSKDTITGLENDHDKSSNSDVNDDFEPPHPDELFSRIRNHTESESFEASVALRSVDNRSGLDGASSITSLATGRGPRTRARTRAEASRSSPSRQRARPYSDAEDEHLFELMHRKLHWEEIEKQFRRRFVERDRKSLQGRWSRNLKFVTPSAKFLRTRGEQPNQRV